MFAMALDTSIFTDKDSQYSYLVKRVSRFKSKANKNQKLFKRVSNPKFDNLASLILGFGACMWGIKKAKSILDRSL